MPGWAAVILSAFFVAGLGISLASAATLATPSRSTTIALTSDETRLVVVNREANTVSIIRVKDAANNDVSVKLAEIGVGLEPRCVAVHPIASPAQGSLTTRWPISPTASAPRSRSWTSCWAGS
jgi:YVTN family beta-propeller protein